MFRKCVALAVFLVAAPAIGAQGPHEGNVHYSSLEQAIGLSNPARSLHTKKGGSWDKLKTADGEPHWGKSAGVVIVRSNTDEDGIALPCIDATEPFDFNGFSLLQARLQSLVFDPSPKRSSLLEIVWSGQVVVNGTAPPAPGSIDQQAFFMCTVSQKDKSVPCSGTAEIPSFAEDMTGDGKSEFVTYHGYVEFDPKHDVTVEMVMLASVNTLVTICGDTVTLKY